MAAAPRTAPSLRIDGECGKQARTKEKVRSLSSCSSSRFLALGSGCRGSEEGREAKANGRVSRTDPPSLAFIHHTGRIRRCGPESTALNAGGFTATNGWPHACRDPHAHMQQ